MDKIVDFEGVRVKPLTSTKRQLKQTIKKIRSVSWRPIPSSFPVAADAKSAHPHRRRKNSLENSPSLSLTIGHGTVFTVRSDLTADGSAEQTPQPASISFPFSISGAVHLPAVFASGSFGGAPRVRRPRIPPSDGRPQSCGSRLSKLFCPKNSGGRTFVLPDYNQSMEQQREMTMKRIMYLSERGVFDGWLTGQGPESELRKLALLDSVGSYDHSLAIKVGVHFFLWYNSFILSKIRSGFV
ncbi:acyl-CoA oxidase [Asimina triloba]